MRTTCTFLLTFALAFLLSASLYAQQTRQPNRLNQTGQPQAQLSEQAQGQQGMAGVILRASTLIGSKVQGSDGKEMGKIEDVAIDPQSGMISYVALATGGHLGMGEKWLAVPWSFFQPQAMAQQSGEQPKGAKHTFVLSLSKEQLQKAPEITKHNWPTFAQVESQFGTQRQVMKPPQSQRDGGAIESPKTGALPQRQQQ